MVLVVCLGAGVLCVLLHLPLVVGLLAARIAVDPQLLGVVEITTEIELLAEIGIALLLFVVGFDPQLAGDESIDLPVAYGDADDPYLPGQLPLGAAKWVIATVRDFDTNLHFVRALRTFGYPGQIAVSAESEPQAQALYDAGANVTIRPLKEALTPLMAALTDPDTQRRPRRCQAA